MSWMECSQDSKVTQGSVTRRFGRVLLAQALNFFTSYNYSYLISPLTLLCRLAFSVFVANITCLAFWEYDTLRCRSGGQSRGALPARGMSLNKEAWQDLPKGEQRRLPSFSSGSYVFIILF